MLAFCFSALVSEQRPTADRATAMLTSKDWQSFKVQSPRRFTLDRFDPAWAGPRAYASLQKDELKVQAERLLKENLSQLADAQELLWANDTYSVLIILQGMDTAGKDGVVKHVMGGLNPLACSAVSFRAPNDEELDHNFLWRYVRHLPERGRIGIFNRSYYEETVAVRVHPEFLARQKLPAGPRDQTFWQQRFEDINAFEKHLVRNGTVVIKCFLHISPAEQRNRLLARLDNPDKRWKFDPSDLEARSRWAEYRRAYEQMIAATATPWAPWYVIPADHKFMARALVSSILTDSIQQLPLHFPTANPQRERLLKAARASLLGEATTAATRTRRRVAAVAKKR